MEPVSELSKQRPMETNRRMLIWVSVIPAGKNVDTVKRIFYKILSFGIFATVLCVSIASCAYYFKYASIDIQKSLYALAQIAAFTSMTYAIIVTFFIRRRFPPIFENLYKICEASKTLFLFIILRMMVVYI